MTIRIATAALASIVLATTVSAQEDENPVHWTATSASKSAVRGDKADVMLSAKIDRGWHIYSLRETGGGFPTKIALPTGQPFAIAGDIKAGVPDSRFDKNFGVQIETYSDKADFTVPVQVDKKAKVGPRKMKLAVTYEVCNANLCLPPRIEKLAVDMRVKGKEGQ